MPRGSAAGLFTYGDENYGRLVYNLAKNYAAYRIYNDELWDSIKTALMDSNGSLKLDLNMGSTSIWDSAALDLMPAIDGLNLNSLGKTLKDAKLDDPTKEPAYSIVYGRGVPVPNFIGSAFGNAELWGLNQLKDKMADGNFAKKFLSETMLYFDDFTITLMPHSGFWQMPTKNTSNVMTPMGAMRVQMEFENVKVNQGIKDSEFKT